MKNYTKELIFNIIILLLYFATCAVVLFCPVISANTPDGVVEYTGLQALYGSGIDGSPAPFAQSFWAQLPMYLLFVSGATGMLMSSKIFDFISIATAIASGVLFFLVPMFCMPAEGAAFAVADLSTTVWGKCVACLPILCALFNFINVTVFDK